MEALKKDETIGLRVSSINKEMISLAASYKGQDVSSYMMGLVMEHVYRDIKEHRDMQKILFEEDALNEIISDIENPPKANSKLLEAAAKHRQKNF
ncbi:MAG: DUF1778 domain-containing protein [Bacteriovoracaceae bacterium]